MFVCLKSVIDDVKACGCVCVCVWGPTDEEFTVLRNLTQALIGDEAQYVVRLANSLFLQSGVHFSPEFLKLMKHYFHAEAETVDFNESAAVAQHINAWVQNHTASKYTVIKFISLQIS